MYNRLYAGPPPVCVASDAQPPRRQDRVCGVGPFCRRAPGGIAGAHPRGGNAPHLHRPLRRRRRPRRPYLRGSLHRHSPHRLPPLFSAERRERRFFPSEDRCLHPPLRGWSQTTDRRSTQTIAGSLSIPRWSVAAECPHPSPMIIRAAAERSTFMASSTGRASSIWPRSRR